MRAFVYWILIATSCLAGASGWTSTKPKLLVVLVIDQFRADYLSRFQSEFRKDGFKALMRDGAYYPLAEYDILQSMTGPGHATILTGAYPYQMGIPLNEWYSQDLKGVLQSVGDPSAQNIGKSRYPNEPASSPKNLIGSTVGDELKNIGLKSRVISISLKDRAAVLLAGKRGDLALWLGQEGWMTSSYYRKDGKLPAWLAAFNKTVPGKDKCEWGAECGVRETLRATRAILENEKLGTGSDPDVLAVSFSSHDMAGHKFGPLHPIMKTVTLAEDQAIAEIRAAVAKQVPGGLKNVVFVLTADHGVAPVPEEVKPAGLDAGRVDEKVLLKRVNDDLQNKFGKAAGGNWIAHVADFNFYLDEESVRAGKLKISDLEARIKSLVRQEPGIAHVITSTEYESRVLPPGVLGRQAMRTYYPGRSGHVVGLVKPFYLETGKHLGNHMTSYSYDRMVPLIISGYGVKPGLYAERAEVVDIAPTLSFLLGILPPALSEGRVLSEMILKKK